MSRDTDLTLAIVGATGAVGVECLAILEERSFPCSKLRLFASPRSAGKTLTFRGKPITIKPLAEPSGGSFDDCDIAIFSAGKGISLEWGPKAVASGCYMVDNSSAYRMDSDKILCVPELNGHLVDQLQSPAIIANPNCSTIIALMAVTPLHRAVGVKRMVVSTYQAASGAGAAAMAELEQQAHAHAKGETFNTTIFGRQYLFNLFSHNTKIGPEGYNEEEMKMVKETWKIWDLPKNNPGVGITATCVRVPVLRAHSEAINLTFEKSLTEDEARQLLNEAPGVTIIDDRANNCFPEPINASGKDDVLVGRIRADISQPPGKGLDLFVCGDQIRKGAALNAIQIAERLVEAGVVARSGASRVIAG